MTIFLHCEQFTSTVMMSLINYHRFYTLLRGFYAYVISGEQRIWAKIIPSRTNRFINFLSEKDEVREVRTIFRYLCHFQPKRLLF